MDYSTTHEKKYNLKKVVFSSSLESVDAGDFDESVEEIEIAENSLYYTVNGALLTRDNTLIFLPKHCEIPDCTERIAPYSCRFLETDELILPKNVKEIQYMGLSGSKINSVVCNEKLEKIGSHAFNSLNLDTGIKSISLGDGLTDICDNAFQGTLLTEIVIPKNVINIGINIFDIRGKLKKIEIDSQNAKYYSNGSNSIIEKSTDKLIAGCKKTIIPGNVKEIGEKAFYSCEISGLDIPSSVSTIGDYCFAFNKLKTIDISNVSSVGIGAFENNADLQNIVLSKKMQSVPAYIVSGCDHLNTVELPDSIELIQTDAFANYLGQKIIIHSGVKVIETRAFSSNHAQLIYKGTKQQWLNIVVNKNVYYNDFGDPKQPKEYEVECIDGKLSVSVFAD